MASLRVVVTMVLSVVGVLFATSAAQSTDCTNTLVSLSPCVDYITGNSSTPSSGCCSKLASVVKSNPECLCQVLSGGGSSLGINVNQTQAEALPGACNVQTPPLSSCKGGSSADSPSGTPKSPNSGKGSKAVPSTDSGSSDASSTRMKISLLFFIVFIASYASTTTIY